MPGVFRRSGEAMPIVKTESSKSLAVLCVLGVVSLASPVAMAQEAADDWQFAATIYGWFPDIGGHTALPFGDDNIDVDISTILDHLKMTFQGSFEFHKGRWGGFTDIVYLDIGESKSGRRDLTIGDMTLPAGITANAEFDLKSTFLTIAGQYRVRTDPDATVDLLAGARLADFSQRLDIEFVGDFIGPSPPPQGGSRKASVEQWDAIVGAKGRVAFGADQRWVLPWYVDVGTGDSDLTWQAVVGLGHVFDWGQLTLTWTTLAYELSDSPIEDLDFSGPAIGATFRW